MPLLLNFLGSGDFLNEDDNDDDGFVPNECGITETLSMVGILERIPISIFNDNNSTSFTGFLRSTYIWTSALETIHAGRNKTDLTLIDSWLNFSSMSFLIISVAF